MICRLLQNFENPELQAKRYSNRFNMHCIRICTILLLSYKATNENAIPIAFPMINLIGKTVIGKIDGNTCSVL